MTKGVQVAGVPHAVVSAGAPALDGITASVANIDAWLRVNVNSKIERCLPRWATANRVTVANAVFAVVCIGAALYVDGAPYWEAMALQSLVITMILVYGVVDLLDGDVARARNQSSPYGGTLDHFVDSIATPLTAAACSVGAQTPARLAIANTILVAFIFCMEATLENDTGEWFEPPPGGFGASLSSAMYVFVNMVFRSVSYWGLVDSAKVDIAWVGFAWIVCIAVVPVTIQLIRSVGTARAFQAGFSFIFAFAVFGVLVEDGNGFMVFEVVRESATGLTPVQFIFLGAAVSNRVSGGMIMRTCEGKRYSGFDWRTCMWTIIIGGLCAARRAGFAACTADAAHMAWLSLALQYLPYIAGTDLLFRGLVDMRALYVRVMLHPQRPE